VVGVSPLFISFVERVVPVEPLITILGDLVGLAVHAFVLVADHGVGAGAAPPPAVVRFFLELGVLRRRVGPISINFGDCQVIFDRNRGLGC